MSYKIVIPTLSRFKKINDLTLKALEDIDKKNIYLFVVEEEYEEYKKVCNDYNIVIGVRGCSEQKKFISNYFDENEVLIFMDDDIKEFYELHNGSLIHLPVDKLINTSLQLLKEVSLVGIYPTPNPYFMKEVIKKDLKFCIGQYQALINKKNIFNNFNFKILEDYERSIEYYLQYGMARIEKYSLKANFGTMKGGWQCPDMLREVELKDAELKDFVARYEDYAYIKKKKKSNDIIFKKIKPKKEICMLWVNKPNDIFELSINSWLYYDYNINLYTDDLDILNKMKIKKNKKLISVRHLTEIMDIELKEVLGFADLFRFKLLFEKGGIWVDSDMVLLKDIWNDIKDKEVVISSEHTFKKGAFKSKESYKPNIGILKFKKEDPLLLRILTRYSDKEETQKLFYISRKFCGYGGAIFNKKWEGKYTKAILPAEYSCPVPWWIGDEIYKNKASFTEKYGVELPYSSIDIFNDFNVCHLWNNFSNNKYKTNYRNYETNSLYDLMKKKYL